MKQTFPLVFRRALCIFCALLLLGAFPLNAFAAQSQGLCISEEGLAFIKSFEGFSATAYAGSNGWYIGYGTGCDKGEYPDGITRSQAEDLLCDELDDCADSLNALLAKSDSDLNQAQFDALLSFTYTLGTQWLASSNRIRTYLLDGIEHYSDLQIVNALGAWCHVSGKVSESLAQRRIEEAKLFLYGDYGDGDSTDYVYLQFDAGTGSVEADIVFYEMDEPYGTLQQASCSSATFAGWYTAAGDAVRTDAVAEQNEAVSASWSSWVNPYHDVAEDAWFFSYVSDLSQSGIVSGYPDGTFLPNSATSAGEALKLILLAAGYSEQAATDGHWAGGYRSFALSNQFADEEDLADLDGQISRLTIARIAAKALGLSTGSCSSPFADTTDSSVAALYEYGIFLGGTDAGGTLLFRPDTGITRAEISAVIWRINHTDFHTGQIRFGSSWIEVLDEVPVNSYDSSLFALDDGQMCYDSDDVEALWGVDVSSHQGVIDWEQVADSGVDYAMIRLGYRGYVTGGICLDDYFIQNIEGAQDAGIDVGVYFFSQAITVAEAQEEANFVLSYLEEYDLQCPVVFDWETIGSSTARTNGLSTDLLCDCADAFCHKIERAGYDPMIYFNQYDGYKKYDLSELVDYDFWYAEYSKTPSFYYNFQMWQYTSSGSVSGISGKTDLNIWLKD